MTATILDAFFSVGEGLPFLPILLVLILVIFWSHAFVVVYHLVRFGIGIRPKIVAFIFFFGSAVLFSLVIFLYSHIEVPSVGQLFSGQKDFINNLNSPFNIE